MAPFTSLVALLFLVLLAPAAHAGTLLDVDHLAVYDATGRQVGSAWPTTVPSDGSGFPIFMYVHFRLGTTPVTVRLRSDGVQFDVLRFSGRRCTGVALFQVDWHDLFPLTPVAAPRGTVYIQSGALRERTVRSTLTVRGGCVTHEEPYTADTVPLKATTVNLTDHFVPPFNTRAFGRTPVERGAP